MPIPNIFLDTNIIADCVVPLRRAKYACSYELVQKVEKGQFKAWSVDYALSETLGILKGEKEERIGTKDISRETLSAYDVTQMVSVIDEFRKTNNFEVFAPEHIPQAEIFDKVKSICVQATDALVLLSVLHLKKKLPNIVLVTRDDKLLVRGKKLVSTAHPIDFLPSCPTKCDSKSICRHRK
jgi:hypothetical protein